MMSKFLFGLIICLALSASALADVNEWRFLVYLDEKEIGYHNFVLREQENHLQLHSEANFEYRLLFVKLYEYKHENTEIWSDNCLTGIKSRTETNGTTYRVSGQLKDDRLVLDGSAGAADLQGCNMSFAYWNPSFLKQDQLINVQNGEILEVDVSEPESVEIEVRGTRHTAWRYLLKAGDMKIELWYSQTHEWLALETEARGGRRLRYVLI